ncbi:MAG: hypothetical protein IJ378_07480 [Alistipes sp.]|nr:hypothetical protein [Alistipes sp.]MBQ7787796.1 hypothetical protein [Alistipes sp.]MBQ7787982.1 hypothetical protein [Alistipes sp.]
MFEFLIPVSIFGFGGYFLYKILELYAMRNERKTIIERLDANGLVEYVKRMPIGVSGGGSHPVSSESQKQVPARWVLRWGLFILGLGIGLFVAWCFSTQKLHQDVYKVYIQMEILYMCGACCGAGLGLFISFITEIIIARTSED